MPVSILVLAFLISLVSFAVFHPEIDGRVFYYPDNSGVRIGSERRGIPQRRGLEAQIQVFLEELALGPIDLELTHTVPRGTDIIHVAVIGNVAYVDLDRRVLKTDIELPVTFDQAIENMRFNILFNFPRVEEIMFTIEGQQVNAPLYTGPAKAE